MKLVMMVLCFSIFSAAFAEEVDTDCLAMSESRDVAAKTDPSIKTQEAKDLQGVIKR